MPRTASVAPFLIRGLLLLSLGVAASAGAQERGFRLHRFEGTEAGAMQFLVDRPWYGDTRTFAVGLTVDDAFNPLVPRVAAGGGDLSPIVSNALVGHLDLAAAFTSRFLVSASLPVTLLERGRTDFLSGLGPASGVRLGDPRVGAMVRLYGFSEREPFSLHAGLDVWIPTGGAAAHQGDVSIRLLPRAVIAGAFGPGRYSVELGFLLRPAASYGPPALAMTAASEARLGLALGLSLLDDRLFVGPEAQASTQVLGTGAFKANGTSVEVLGGAHWLLFNRVLVGVGGGVGFFGAAGTPDARLMARIAWAPRRSPESEAEAEAEAQAKESEHAKTEVLPDGGVAPATPASPAVPDAGVPGALAGVARPTSSTGDADGDGIADAVDRCPYEPETKNGIRDEDGCPEVELTPGAPLVRVLAPKVDAGVPVAAADAGVERPALDSDGDGIPDSMDRCPVTPEDKDDFEDEDGCPERDNDADGILDAADKCPNEAETFNGVDDEDGCPDLAKDSDGDGLADLADRCPFEAATPGGARTDGCPEAEVPHREALAALLKPPSAVSSPGVSVVAPVSRDADGDGLPDDADRCPITPEDQDGFEDDDGCPEPDNDGDAIVDGKDACPLEAETVNGNRDDDGCPDEPADADGDGVDSERDRCPLEPGDASDGCPHTPLPALALPGFPGAAATPVAAGGAPVAADLDRDGLADDADACPTSPEDKDDFEDEDGCPELDNDHDGIADAKDKCPLEAETINGFQDDDGCPDVGASAIKLTKDRVVLSGTIRFKIGSAELDRSSLPLLKQLAGVLKAYPHLPVEIQGHTDDVGSAAANIKLSQKRAESIRTFLSKAGVALNRLVATGYGPTRPVASNKTLAGRELNRRVEFLILGEAQ
ncbi:MAG: thrombospondin type 3 repeat-containing protein [Myxococcaceae bacterium]|nr:thrombospondin type 3 repeat-containing protein [Myxococcaceae bacterium]